MSFNAKNLSYESKEPAFLRRIRNDYGDHDSSRHERPLARPRKQVQEGEKEDEPTYITEGTGDILSKAEYEALVAADHADNEDKSNNLSSSIKANCGIEESKSRDTEVIKAAALVKGQVAGIGVSTKRRPAKVFGTEDEDEADPIGESGPGRNNKNSRIKKGKKMKLSFHEHTEP